MESRVQRPAQPATAPSYLAAARSLQGVDAGCCAVPSASPAHGPRSALASLSGSLPQVPERALDDLLHAGPAPLPHLRALPTWPQTLQNEILGHAPRVEDVLQRGQRLVEAAEIDCQDIQERLGHLQGSWDTLQEAAAGRLQRLRDASEAQQYYLDASEAEAWISEQELYIISDETPKVGWGWGWRQAGSQGREEELGWGSQWAVTRRKSRCVRTPAATCVTQSGAPFANLDLIEPKISPPFSCHGFCNEGLPGGRES